jgi:hypothetical protein
LAVHTEDLADGPYIYEAAPVTPKTHHSAGRSPLLPDADDSALDSFNAIRNRSRHTG